MKPKSPLSPDKFAAGLMSCAVAVALIWLTGCQLPAVVKETVTSSSSPSIGADLGGASAKTNPVKKTIDPTSPGLLRFSHNMHVVENDIECDMCHGIQESARPLMPDHETCLGCHDFEETEPGEECLTCHILSAEDVAAEAFEEISVTRVPETGDFRFNHSAFADDPSVCVNCHTQANESALSTDNIRGDHDSLFPRVEDAGGNTSDCSICHTSMDKNTPPASHHASGFLQAHGGIYESGGGDLCMACHTQNECQTCHEQTQPTSHRRPEWRRSHGKVGTINEEKCLLCHTEQSCRTCHSTEKPKDHTHFFRRRSHGKIASINRDRCLVCHKQDYCEACHVGASPMLSAQPYHVPGSACLACHSPGSAVRPLRRHGPLPEDSCLNCHRFQ